VFSALFFPEATPEQSAAFDELQRVSASPENAVRFRHVFNTIDVRRLAHQVRVPTLILHVRDDGAVPFEEGRLLASLIPGARFVPLEGRNHLMLSDEPAWPSFLAEVRTFLAGEGTAGRGRVGEGTEAVELLSRREREVLCLVAVGLTNAEISTDLVLSTRTVERHLSNIYAKLGVSGKSARAAAAARGARLPQAHPELLVGR
jgi:DNA-binding CsgD family transcriptional regulator